MTCSDCGYEMRPGQPECPRCLFQLHIRQQREDPAPTTAAEEPTPVLTPSTPMITPVPTRWRGVVAALGLGVIGCLLIPPLLSSHRVAQATATQEDSARAVFAQADGACRQGAEMPCRGSIAELVALRDHSDAAFLLGDFRVARYLQTRPGGSALEERWKQDSLSADELMALADASRRQRLLVFRSFWMYENAKQSHIAVPTLAINNEPSPFGTQ